MVGRRLTRGDFVWVNEMYGRLRRSEGGGPAGAFRADFRNGR